MSLRRKKIGNFYLVDRLGSNGMSEVFLGVNPKTREKRAFKILGKRPMIWPSEHARFFHEIDIMRSLSHPGIIRIQDRGILENRYYFSMEFIPGGNLNRRLERGEMPVENALELFASLCGAMAYAHEEEVVHRDLKPSNILLTAAGDPIISDFGIAGIWDTEPASLTHFGNVLGDIAYLAPEQRFGSMKVSRKADVYALGAILYEMLMGFPPLGNYAWPRDVRPGFPERLQSILQKCLTVNPESRFEHAGFLLRELEKWPEFGSLKRDEIPGDPAVKGHFATQDALPAPAKTDRIEAWFLILRAGTIRERLDGVREMVEKITPAEAKALLKLYPEESDRVRWGLIRVLGELKIEAATPLILNDLNSPFHAECAIEALGKIGSSAAFNAIRKHVMEHPENTAMAMIPMARTGKQRAIKYLRRYLNHEAPAVRQAAIQGIASIATMESLQTLKDHLCAERDEKVRVRALKAVQSLQAIALPDIKDPAQRIQTHANAIHL